MTESVWQRLKTRAPRLGSLLAAFGAPLGPEPVRTGLVTVSFGCLRCSWRVLGSFSGDARVVKKSRYRREKTTTTRRSRRERERDRSTSHQYRKIPAVPKCLCGVANNFTGCVLIRGFSVVWVWGRLRHEERKNKEKKEAGKNSPVNNCEKLKIVLRSGVSRALGDDVAGGKGRIWTCREEGARRAAKLHGVFVLLVNKNARCTVSFAVQGQPLIAKMWTGSMNRGCINRWRSSRSDQVMERKWQTMEIEWWRVGSWWRSLCEEKSLRSFIQWSYHYIMKILLHYEPAKSIDWNYEDVERSNQFVWKNKQSLYSNLNQSQ